jgi:hypothetical protein
MLGVLYPTGFQQFLEDLPVESQPLFTPFNPVVTLVTFTVAPLVGQIF